MELFEEIRCVFLGNPITHSRVKAISIPERKRSPFLREGDHDSWPKAITKSPAQEQ